MPAHDDVKTRNLVPAILDLIHKHLALHVGESSVLERDLAITPDFLFSVCVVLSSHMAPSGPDATMHVLPAVLRCLRRTWRTQPADARCPDALAQELAVLARSGDLIPQHSQPNRILRPQSQVLDNNSGLCKQQEATGRRSRYSLSSFEPLKIGTPLRDLRIQTPRPLAPHRVRRIERELDHVQPDENEPPAPTPSRTKRIYAVRTALSPIPHSPQPSHHHPGEIRPF